MWLSCITRISLSLMVEACQVMLAAERWRFETEVFEFTFSRSEISADMRGLIFCSSCRDVFSCMRFSFMNELR